MWLQAEGFSSVYVLRNGLHAWKEARYPTVPISNEVSPVPSTSVLSPPAPPLISAHSHTFLPGLAQTYLTQHHLPMRKKLAILFVDIADSTATIINQPPEVALAFVQRFMAMVTDIALANCGDVKDYEGDGALLYFESVTEATQAALAIRDVLARQPLPGEAPVRARISLNVGDMIIGVIGTAMRQTVALIGPSINLASRLLKQIPPGGIIATAAVVEHLRKETPSLAERFTLWNARLTLKGFTEEYVTAYHIP